MAHSLQPCLRRELANSTIPAPIRKKKPGAHRWVTRRVLKASALSYTGNGPPQYSPGECCWAMKWLA